VTLISPLGLPLSTAIFMITPSNNLTYLLITLNAY
jgi:hypothetical protein